MKLGMPLRKGASWKWGGEGQGGIWRKEGFIGQKTLHIHASSSHTWTGCKTPSQTCRAQRCPWKALHSSLYINFPVYFRMGAACLHAEIFILLINLSLEFIYLNPCLVRFFFFLPLLQLFLLKQILFKKKKRGNTGFCLFFLGKTHRKKKILHFLACAGTRGINFPQFFAFFSQSHIHQ